MTHACTALARSTLGLHFTAIASRSVLLVLVACSTQGLLLTAVASLLPQPSHRAAAAVVDHPSQ